MPCLGIVSIDLIAIRGACTINQHIDRTQQLFSLTCGCLRVLRPGEVGHQRHDVEAIAAERLTRALEVLLAARRNRHTRAFRGDRSRAGDADSFAATGDQDNLSIETEFHSVVTPSVSALRMSSSVGGVWESLNRASR